VWVDAGPAWKSVRRKLLASRAERVGVFLGLGRAWRAGPARRAYSSMDRPCLVSRGPCTRGGTPAEASLGNYRSPSVARSRFALSDIGACTAMVGPGQRPSPSVRVRSGLGDTRRPTTVIEAAGEHDYDSRGLLVAALEQVDGHVVIDLSGCTFIDTSVIGAIIGGSSRRRYADRPARARGSLRQGWDIGAESSPRSSWRCAR
jgi:hypothetical protein